MLVLSGNIVLRGRMVQCGMASVSRPQSADVIARSPQSSRAGLSCHPQ